MKNPVPPPHFGPEQAAAYDERWVRTAPIRDCLNLLQHQILSTLPSNARILCVGAGTGVELMDLANKNPNWTFVAVEPAAAMLDICRKKVRAAGFELRCEFHEGYLDSLANSKPFDGATSILVSQFLTDTSARTEYFRQISKRLKSQGVLVSADLAHDLSSDQFDDLLKIWARTTVGSDSKETIENIKGGWKKDVGVLPPAQTKFIIEAGGFDSVILFYQALFIHAWYARKA